MFEEIPILRLTKEDFKIKDQMYCLKNNDKYTFIMLYADYCGFCHRAAPSFIKFYKMVKNSPYIQLAVIDGVNEKFLSKMYLNEGYPTFLLLSPNGKYIYFQGDRTPENFLDFVHKYILY
jgi:protein disulfide-isomerase A1